MRRLPGFIELTGVLLGLCTWGIIPDLLWDYGYKLCAMISFLLIPAGLFSLVQSYDEWRRSKPQPRLARRI